VTTEPYDQRPKRRYRVRAEMMIQGLEGGALERDLQPYGIKGSTTYQSATEGRSTMPAPLVAALKRHEATLYRVASGILGQPQEAEEVLQETWLRVYETIHTFSEHAALSTRLYRIVVNAALTRLRAIQEAWGAAGIGGASRCRGGGVSTGGSGVGSPPEEALRRQELRMALQQGIDGLSEPYRIVYVWAEIEGRPHRELATGLGLTVGTVKTRLHRAHRWLRGMLMAEWGTDGRRSGVHRRSRTHGHSLGHQRGVGARRRRTALGTSPHLTRISE
jgi:RNA polymerase sigma-70 factor, ECF subfamily